LKWAGGKTSSLPELLKRVPNNINTYYESFLGGGALFFALANEVAAGKRSIESFVLSDVNEELITTYLAIRDKVGAVIHHLEAHAESYNRGPENYYYGARAMTPLAERPALTAARMILLNKTGFNGLYRVNTKGGFNVPWGKYETFSPDVDNLRACSESLKGVDIRCGTFVDIFCGGAGGPGDFVYFDPPYVPIAKDSFTSYTKDKFTWTDQEKLAGIAERIRTQGGTVILSNANRPEIRKLYKGFKIEDTKVARSINSDGGKRQEVGELIITGEKVYEFQR
jgi:DNA adenine methylase